MHIIIELFVVAILDQALPFRLKVNVQTKGLALRSGVGAGFI